MRTRLTVAGISVAVVTGLAIAGGVALAAEDNPHNGGTPTPTVSAGVDDKGGLRGTSAGGLRGTSAGGLGHDVGDDHGVHASPTPDADDADDDDADDAASDAANDDHGGQRGADDAASHKANDDHGGQRSGHGSER